MFYTFIQSTPQRKKPSIPDVTSRDPISSALDRVFISKEQGDSEDSVWKEVSVEGTTLVARQVMLYMDTYLETFRKVMQTFLHILLKHMNVPHAYT